MMPVCLAEIGERETNYLYMFAGIRPGDVIRSVGGISVFNQVIVGSAQPIALLLNRPTDVLTC